LRESKRFFFEKKQQKLLVLRALEFSGPTPAGPKVFYFFFSKKKRFLLPSRHFGDHAKLIRNA